MSATKREDHLFLNETRLLVRNDTLPKTNKSFGNIAYNFEPEDDPITLANKKENSLLLINDRISQRAEQPPSDFITKSNYDPERDELLKEYNKEHPSSFEYIDANGDKKYRQFLLPEFEVNLKPELPEFKKNVNTDRRINYLKNRIESDEIELINLDKAIEKIKLKLNHKNITKENATKKLKRFDDIIKQKKQEIDKNYTILKNLIRLQDLEKEREKDLNTKNAQIREENHGKVKAYKDTLNLLNKGQFNTQQEFGETDDDYLNRLRNNAEIEVPQEQAEDMVFLTNSRFRKNMKNLLRSNTIIEQLLNTISNLDKLEINKRFAYFKNEFEKIFGLNNNQINVQDILNFIEKFKSKFVEKQEKKNDELNFDMENNEEDEENRVKEDEEYPKEINIRIKRRKIKNQTPIKTQEEHDQEHRPFEYPEEEHRPFTYTFLDEKFHFYIAVKNNLKNLTYKFLVSESGQKGSFIEIKEKDYKQRAIVQDLYADLMTTFGTRSKSELAKRIAMQHPECVIKYEDTIKHGRNQPVGYGIKSDIKSKYAQLGRYQVNLQSLYYKNFFKLYSMNGDKVGDRGVKVSDLFVRLICQLVEGKKPSHEEIHLLPSTELHLFNWTIQKCGLKSKHSSVSLNLTVNELKKRLELLEGEISIGNDNPEIVKEIINILHHLKDFNVISNKKIKNYLSQFEIY